MEEGAVAPVSQDTLDVAEPVQEVELEDGDVCATFVIKNLSGAQKERVEELVLAHQGHRRTGEQLGFSEVGMEMHVRHSGVDYHSLQHVIAKMNALRAKHGVQYEMVME